jgi:DNA-binding Lrp family transcriptional regulator
MDDTDRKILSFLRHSGRASITTLSQELKLARATVRVRIESLTQAGEILGFSVILKNDSRVHPIRGMMMIEITGRGTESAIQQLSAIPSVTTINTTNGRWDLIIELGTETLEDLDKLLGEIRLIKDITASETSLLLATRKFSPHGETK